MACAIEDAGFEIRDSIHWVYGSGFPKSLNIGKAIDKAAGAEREVLGTRVLQGRAAQSPKDKGGTYTAAAPSSAGLSKEVPVTAPATPEAARWEGWGTALKPAHEPVVVARKPLSGTVAGNVLVWGTGGLNIDGCRVPSQDGYEKAWDRPVSTNIGAGGQGNYISDGSQHTIDISNNKPEGGRWPANIVLDGAAAAALDQQSGVSKSSSGGRSGTHPAPMDWGKDDTARDRGGHTDSGGASRFFTQADFGPDDWPFVYQAKPSKRERNAGLDGLPEQPSATAQGMGITQVTANSWGDKDQTVYERTTAHSNHHPTVKPVALMRHLVRLVTPPGGTVLDPFAGSGTTLVAAVLEGFDAIGCEMTDEYLPIIRGRVAWAKEQRDSEQPRLL
jgi:hypothetical protein